MYAVHRRAELVPWLKSMQDRHAFAVGFDLGHQLGQAIQIAQHGEIAYQP